MTSFVDWICYVNINNIIYKLFDLSDKLFYFWTDRQIQYIKNEHLKLRILKIVHHVLHFVSIFYTLNIL